VITQSLKFGGTTLGRDKTHRAVQYLARFLTWYLQSKGDKLDAARWNALKVHLGTARKLLRLGKPMEHLQAALRAALTSAPAAEQATTIARQLGYFGYLSYDVLVWANTIKFIKLTPENAKRVAKISNRFWLAGILFSIVNGVIKTRRLSQESKSLRNLPEAEEKSVSQAADRETRLAVVSRSQATTRRQFIIDLLDVWIPAAGLELVQVNEGALGIVGFISSVLGGHSQWVAVHGK